MSEEKSYTLRGLKAEDLFLVVKIVNKIGLKQLKTCFDLPDVKAAIAQAAGGKEEDLSAVGMMIMLEISGTILEHLPESKNEIYALLSSLSGMDAKDIAQLPSGTFTKMIMDVVRKDEFKDFFRDVFGLFG